MWSWVYEQEFGALDVPRFGRTNNTVLSLVFFRLVLSLRIVYSSYNAISEDVLIVLKLPVRRFIKWRHFLPTSFLKVCKLL